MLNRLRHIAIVNIYNKNVNYVIEFTYRAVTTLKSPLLRRIQIFLYAHP
jgi:hypothetical protein